MLIATLLLIACAAGVHLAIRRRRLSPPVVVETVLLYLLLFSAGLGGLNAFVGHLFFSDRIATGIGWPTGNPFQLEVAIGDGAWGLLGVLCIWLRGRFWLATGLGWSVFLIGAGVVHLRDTWLRGNLAPYNAGMIVPNFLLPALILVFLAFYWRQNREAMRGNLR